jgi:integrase
MLIRNDTYHYRRRIPSDLFHLFGRKEVTKSLHTKQPRDAVRLRSRLDVQMEQLFHACRMEAVSPELATARLNTILHGHPLPTSPLPSTEQTPIVILPSRRRGKRLAEAVDVYCKENQHGWTPKTAKEFAGIYDRLIKGLSDPWLQDIDRPSLVEYRDKLIAEGKHAKTVNKYLQILSTVLRHASRLKWITGNPAEGLGLKDARREDEIRRAYTSEEITQLFLALQRDKKAFYESNHHERYWLPLLGIFTGGRVNELAQLSLADIVVEQGIPAIVITAAGNDEGKRIKSESARRTLPLHRDLLTLGFMVYVKNMRERGHDRLFPALKLGPNGYSHQFVSRHFSGKDGWLRRNIPTAEDGVAFHSFRHTVATMLKNAEEPERLIIEIMGHKQGSLAMGRYATPYDLSIKTRSINKIDYKIIPQPHQLQELVEVGDDRMEPIEFLICGDFKIPVDPDEKKAPLEVRQYCRPDMHGYSIFHKAIPAFLAD